MTTTDKHATLRRGDDVSNRDGNRRPRIDWDAAFAYFASDPTISFGKVGKQFGVSDVAVGKHAKRDNWNQRRAELLEQAANSALQRARRTREQRITKVLGLVDSAIDGFDTQLDAKIAEAKLSDLPALVKLTELLEGEATDRVDVTRVQPLIAAFVVKVAVLVPAERDGELSGVLDWFEGELRALEPGERAA